MQQANASTVLGNFRNTQFAKDGLTSTFYLKDKKYYVRTDGPEGTLNDYPVAYTSAGYWIPICFIKTALPAASTL
jgi:hypothetical protein